MTRIIDLTQRDAVETGDQFPIWSAATGDSARVPVTAVGVFVSEYLGLRQTDDWRASPSATGFVVALTGTNDIRLVLTPTGTMAAGSITLPTGPVSNQTVNVVSSQAVTALTFTGATAGAPTTLAANGYFTLRYDATSLTWRRIA